MANGDGPAVSYKWLTTIVVAVLLSLVATVYGIWSNGVLDNRSDIRENSEKINTVEKEQISQGKDLEYIKRGIDELKDSVKEIKDEVKK